ncbi:MAG: TatD family nuclease-associated radical SAM protein [Eubacteriales bacterium]|jgi:TatD family-associated radical SAM protein
MTITYEVGNSLYVNVTNRCTNNCTFCVRHSKDMYNGKDNMWLEREPTSEEILADIRRRDLSRYKHLVFCGYGEPSYRLPELCDIAKIIKKESDIPIRINTNGHADHIWGRPMAPLMEGAIDICSISLNESTPERYDEVCKPNFEGAFQAMLDFAAEAKKYVPKVVLSIVDVIPQEEIERCRAIAQQLGVEFRVRAFIS